MSATIKKLLEVWEKRPDFWDPNNVVHLEWTSQELLPAVVGALPALRAAVGVPAVVPPPPVIPPSKDPEMRWDEELGWVHEAQLDVINEMRGEIARARGKGDKHVILPGTFLPFPVKDLPASPPSQIPGPDVSVPSTGTQESLQSEERSNRILNATPSTAGTAEASGQTEGTGGTPASEPATFGDQLKALKKTASKRGKKAALASRPSAPRAEPQTIQSPVSL